MGFMDNVKSLWHSVTTEDHYALYGSPYKNSSAGGSLNNNSSSRLQDLNNSLTHLLISRNSTSNIGYRPGMRSSSTNLTNPANSDVQMQSLGSNGQPPLPSVEALWLRIEAWLEEEYPELEDSLNSGASTADLNEFEKDLQIGPFPVEVRQSFKVHDGQFRGGKPTGLLMGMTLLDMESSMEQYALWAKVAERVEKQQMMMENEQRAELGSSSARERLSNSFIAHQKSIPVDAVQSYYVHRGWVPIAKDMYGNLVGLDLAPGPAGIRGQIILYGRDFDTKVVVATSLQELLFQFVTDLELGNFQIDHTQENEDNGFLDSSRTDDYMIGDEDEGNGELAFVDRDSAEFGPELKGKLSYIEVLKRRALRRFGVQNVDTFQTAFTPQRIAKKRAVSGAASPKVASPLQSKLINLDSTVDLPKETLIDDEPSEPVEPLAKNEPKVAETAEAKLEDKVEAPTEVEETKEEQSKVEIKIVEPEVEEKIEKKVEKAPLPADATTEIAL